MATAAAMGTGRAPTPFLKWVGGKRQLLRDLLGVVPSGSIRLYVEPFVGGAALFFELARLNRIRAASLSDTNEDLIAAYQAVRDDVDGVIEALSLHVNSAPHFYRVRAADPLAMSLPERAARLIFLNRCGYNGLYRVNASGQFNVPFGRYANPTICDPQGLRTASAALQRAELHVRDFGASFRGLRRGDVVYCDPPYVPVSKTAAFTSYTRGGFGLEAQERLRDHAALLKERGIRVVLSNSATATVRDLYSGFDLQPVRARRLVNCQAAGRGPVGEYIIT